MATSAMPSHVASMIGALSGPMAQLATLEACPGFTVVFGSSATTMGQLNPDFISHKETFMVLGHTLHCSVSSFELNKAITNF
jgi:light-regulated signal transduction histidine kinase (bacteriophytochrome)